MSRLLLSSVLVALVVGLTLLACVPIEDEWLGEIGDEFQITDDAVVQHDPVFYNTKFGDSIKEAQVAYHDGSSIYLYDIASKATETLYQAPSGYTITTMCTMGVGTRSLEDLVFSLSDANESIILRESDGSFEEIYRDTGLPIDNIAIEEGGRTLYMHLERGGETFVYVNGIVTDSYGGIEPNCEDGGVFLSTGLYDGVPSVYEYYQGYFLPLYHDGSNLHWSVKIEDDILRTETFLTSDQDGDVDIYRLFPNNNGLSQVCNMDGVENELSGWDKYVLFTRTVNGQTDVFIIRGDY